MNVLAMWTPAFIIGYLLILAVDITASVMLALAVYNDAKSKWNANAVMWAVLVGIFRFDPGHRLSLRPKRAAEENLCLP